MGGDREGLGGRAGREGGVLDLQLEVAAVLTGWPEPTCTGLSVFLGGESLGMEDA